VEDGGARNRPFNGRGNFAGYLREIVGNGERIEKCRIDHPRGCTAEQAVHVVARAIVMMHINSGGKQCWRQQYKNDAEEDDADGVSPEALC